MSTLRNNLNYKPAIACDLSTLQPTDRERLEKNFREALKQSSKIESLHDGFALFFAKTTPDLILKLADIIAYDHICCPFIRHAFISEPYDHGSWLQLTGGKQIKKYIASEFNHLLSDEMAAAKGFHKNME